MAPEQTIITASENTPKVQVSKQMVTETSEKTATSKSKVNETKETKSISNEPSGTVPIRPTYLDPPKTTTKNDLFVSPSAFPTWDD